ncbi:MAG: hypothetical protein HY716_16380 [Planctomycetes bacterium]|nr:hypothetical protein [Planctomycetota bacterium]
MVYPAAELFGRPVWLQDISQVGTNPHVPFIGSFVPQLSQIPSAALTTSAFTPFSPWASNLFGYQNVASQVPGAFASPLGYNPAFPGVAELTHAQGLRPALSAVICPPQVAQQLIARGLAQPAMTV